MLPPREAMRRSAIRRLLARVRQLPLAYAAARRTKVRSYFMGLDVFEVCFDLSGFEFIADMHYSSVHASFT
jgi:hypothetical protein